MKTVLFVPGFHAEDNLNDYKGKAAVEAIQTAGYPVRFVPIHWKRTTLKDWLMQLEEIYKDYDPAETILAGFSFGSYTALLAASKRQPAELWLFSLSPYFADDMPHMKKSWLNNIGHRRADEFRKVGFEALARRVTCPVKLFAGSIEMKKYPLIERRFKIAGKQLRDCISIVADGAGHQIEHPAYVAAVAGHI